MSKLAVAGVSKTFQGQRVLHQVSLDLRPGEIHCLLGQNGSGKSTLIKILAGYHTPDGGDAVGSIDGVPFTLGSPTAGHEAGLRFIHQDLALIDDFTIIDNLALGESYGGRFWLSERRERRRAREIFAQYGLDIDANKPLNTLGAAERTMTAIVRALYHGDAARGVLVLDEPTASLSAGDKDHLFGLLRDVKGRGGTILYVTHRLGEVFELADRVSVLRDGHLVGTQDVDALDHDGLVEMILGRSLDALYPDPPVPGTDLVLEIKGLRRAPLRDFSGTVHAGEIVGVVGLAGSGVDQIPKLIFGAERKAAGEVRLMGVPIEPRSPSDGVRHGLAFVPGDRKRLGGMPDWTLRENVTLPKIKGIGPLAWLGPRRERADVTPFLDVCEVKPSDPEATLSSLSGGNQQKIMLARWLRCGAKVFLLEEPTAGVDVGARRAIYVALDRVAKDGAGVLMITSDLEEACGVCDRIYVIRDGHVGMTCSTKGLTVDALLGEMLRSDKMAMEGAASD